jgi:cytochrome P450 family 26 subfamily A
MDQVTKHHFDTHWSPPAPYQDRQKQVVVKVHSLATKYTFTSSCKLFLNTDDVQVIAKLEELVRHVSAGVISLPVDLPGTNFNRAIRASKQIRKEIESMVVQRKIDLMNRNLIDPSTTQDLMSSLLMESYSDGQEMTEAGIANRLYGLLFGAYDTIITTLCSIVMFLSQLPQVYDAVLKGTYIDI